MPNVEVLRPMEPSLRALYICYLSLADPLVHTQVVAYLDGLARRGHVVHLLTFDPPLAVDRKNALREDLASRGITWHSLRYHKRPSLLATIFDVLVGTAVATRLVRRHRLSAVHARNHVPAAAALLVRGLAGTKLIFDIRGLMAEEYADAGRWKRNGLAYRITHAIQRAAIARADGLVMLTEAVKAHLLGRPPSRDCAYVIPCCANLERIEQWLPGRADVRSELGVGTRPVMAYVGKFTGRYMEREMVEFFVAARRVRPDLFFLTLTQSDPEVLGREFVRLGIGSEDYLITSASPDEVGRYLAGVDFATCFYQPKFSEIAASPTKVGEYLGAGVPVVATAGIGDVDDLIAGREVGVLIGDFTPAAYAAAAEQILAFAGDPECRERCRAIARAHLSLKDVGIPRYDRLYREVARG
jgi:glycosyltransferase involved in cell wall biosynthesis